MITNIDTSCLENVKTISKGITARCPACAANGEDKSGNNLFIGDNGFCCVKYKDDKQHSKIIFLALKKSGFKEEDFKEFQIQKEEIKTPKRWSPNLLKKLYYYDDYWNKRGVSSKVLRELSAGYAPKGSFEMSSRYVFPIFDDNKNIMAWAGRVTSSLTEKELKELKIPKWKIVGDIKEAIYPRISIPYIEEAKKVYLVEGISDIVYLYTHGYKNCLSIFGTQIYPGLLKYLISLKKTTIYLSLNNEPNGPGEKAVRSIVSKLDNLFDDDRIKIAVPPQKDFALCSKEELNNFFKCH